MVLARWYVTVTVTSVLMRVGETNTAVVAVSDTYWVVKVCVLNDIVVSGLLMKRDR